MTPLNPVNLKQPKQYYQQRQTHQIAQREENRLLWLEKVNQTVKACAVG